MEINIMSIKTKLKKIRIFDSLEKTSNFDEQYLEIK